MKLSEWIILYNYCACRVPEGADPMVVANRIAMIEKTPRVRVDGPDARLSFSDKVPYRNHDGSYWMFGPKGSSCSGEGSPQERGGYGFYEPSRVWCDRALLELGHEVPNPVIAHGGE